MVFSFVQFSFGLRVCNQPALLACPHWFKIGQFVVGRTGRHDDAWSDATIPGERFIVGFACADDDDVNDNRRAALFKSGDASGIGAGHVMREPQGRQCGLPTARLRSIGLKS